MTILRAIAVIAKFISSMGSAVLFFMTVHYMDQAHVPNWQITAFAALMLAIWTSYPEETP